MREEKWGVLERFRVRPEYVGRLAEVAPDLLRRFVARRMSRLGDGYVLGPFEFEEDGATWWTLLWEFRSREAADAFLARTDDETWNRCVETRLTQGYKHLPDDGLPGF